MTDRPKWTRFDRVKGVDKDNYLAQTYGVCEALVDRKPFRGSYTFRPMDIFKDKRSIRNSEDAFRKSGVILKNRTVFIKDVNLFNMIAKWDTVWWETALDREIAWCIINNRPYPEFTVRDLGELARTCHQRGVYTQKPPDVSNKPIYMSPRELQRIEDEGEVDENIRKFIADMERPDFLHMYYEKYPELLIKMLLTDRFSHPNVSDVRVVKAMKANGLYIIKRWINGEEAEITGLPSNQYKVANLKKLLSDIDCRRYHPKILDKPTFFNCECGKEKVPHIGYTVCEECRELKLKELKLKGDRNDV